MSHTILRQGNSVCCHPKTRFESGPVTADLTTTVVHSYKLLINNVKSVHSIFLSNTNVFFVLLPSYTGNNYVSTYSKIYITEKRLISAERRGGKKNWGKKWNILK